MPELRSAAPVCLPKLLRLPDMTGQDDGSSHIHLTEVLSLIRNFQCPNCIEPELLGPRPDPEIPTLAYEFSDRQMHGRKGPDHRNIGAAGSREKHARKGFVTGAPETRG